MRYPEFLKENGTIGFVAPSFGENIEPYRTQFDSALSKFKAMGYYVNLGPNCYCGQGIGISNTPENCAKELTEYYVNQDSDVLISCGGGELMCETISHVPFDVIKDAKPKWFLGYSDNTNMTFLLTTICDVASLYGPCASSFGMKEWHRSIQDSFDVLTGRKAVVSNYDKYEAESLKDEENPLVSYNLTEDVNISAYCYNDEVGEDLINGGVMSTDIVNMKGRLLGGCLDCLANIVGTKWDYVNQFNEKYKDDGIIWYLEACDLNVFSVRRALWEMENAGWFENAKGFIFGRPRIPEEMMGLNHINAVLPYTAISHRVPVICDADIGHLPPQMTIINGALAEVSYNHGNLVIDMSSELY